MSSYKDAAIVVRLAEALQEHDSFCGETHLQKGTYLLKELCGVPLEYPFSLFIYGPYSFALHRDLGHMCAENLLDQVPRVKGATFLPSSRAGLLFSTYAKTLDRTAPLISFVAERIAKLRVTELEPLATAVLVRREMPDDDAAARAERLRAIKAHLAPDEALEAVTRADQWLAEAPQFGEAVRA
jgi:uncharacterized protein YwgA